MQTQENLYKTRSAAVKKGHLSQKLLCSNEMQWQGNSFISQKLFMLNTNNIIAN